MEEKEQKIISRPPVVVILGHVDHGKSSILEAIKDLKITERESGGITQHLGAYEIEHQGKKITFLDTPGHEAFSSMRNRGARVADIAILVVAADEGIKAQTKEALACVEKTKIPMIVAINKIDKPEANPSRVKQSLSEVGVFVESIGGKVPSVELSAKTKQGIEELLEMVLLLSELEDLKSAINVPGKGVIVESHLDSFKGPTATAIIEEGILKKGDILATESSFGRVRSIENFQGSQIEEAPPSSPVAIFGFEEVPTVGEEFRVFEDLNEAKGFVKTKVENRELKVKEEGQDIMNLIIKTDTQGSLEAIEGMLNQIPQERVLIKIVKSDVGDITETDVKLAETSNSFVLGFKVKISSETKEIIDRTNTRVFLFDIIYNLIDATRKLMEEIAVPRTIRTDLGKFKSVMVFLSGKDYQIIGGKVIEGEMRKGASLEVYRKENGEEKNIGRGKIANLKRGEKNTEKVMSGEDCGIQYEGNVKIQEGDLLLAYIEEKEKLSFC